MEAGDSKKISLRKRLERQARKTRRRTGKNLREIRYEDVKWMELDPNRIQWLHCVSAVLATASFLLSPSQCEYCPFGKHNQEAICCSLVFERGTDHPYWWFSWLSSGPLGVWKHSTSIRPRPLPSISFTIYHLTTRPYWIRCWRHRRTQMPLWKWEVTIL